MATKKASKKGSNGSAVRVSTRLQIGFLGAIGLAWLAQVIMSLSVFNLEVTEDFGVLAALSQVFFTLYPFFLFGVALIYAWSRYTSLLHRLFIAGLIAIVAQTIFSAIYSLASYFRMKFDLFMPDVVSNGNNLLAFDNIILLVSLGVFVLAIGYLDARKKAK